MSRYKIGQKVDGITTEGTVKLKVLGFHNDGVIVEVREAFFRGDVEHQKGEVFVADQFNLIESDPNDEGWGPWKDRQRGHVLDDVDGVTISGQGDDELDIAFFKGADDRKPVIQIDGQGDFRINVNDAPVYDRHTDTESVLNLAALALYRQMAGMPHMHSFNARELRDALIDAGFTPDAGRVE